MEEFTVEEDKLQDENQHGQTADVDSLLQFSEKFEFLAPSVVVSEEVNAGWTAASPQPRYVLAARSRTKGRQKDINNDTPWGRLVHTCPFSGVDKLRLAVSGDYTYRQQNGEYRAAKHRQRQVKLAREKNVPLTVEQRLLQRDIRRELRGATRTDKLTDPIELRDYKLAGPSDVRNFMTADSKSDESSLMDFDTPSTSHPNSLLHHSGSNLTAAAHRSSQSVGAPTSVQSRPEPAREYTLINNGLWRKSDSETDRKFSKARASSSPLQLPPISKPVMMPHRRDKASISLTEVRGVEHHKAEREETQHQHSESEDRVKTPASLPATRAGEVDANQTSRIAIRYTTSNRANRTQSERFRERNANKRLPKNNPVPKDFLSVVSNEASVKQPNEIKELKAPAARVEVQAGDLSTPIKGKLHQEELAASILEHLQEALTASQVTGPSVDVAPAPHLLRGPVEHKRLGESTLGRPGRRGRHKPSEQDIEIFLPNLTGKKMNMRTGSQRIL